MKVKPANHLVRLNGDYIGIAFGQKWLLIRRFILTGNVGDCGLCQERALRNFSGNAWELERPNDASPYQRISLKIILHALFEGNKNAPDHGKNCALHTFLSDSVSITS